MNMHFIRDGQVIAAQEQEVFQGFEVGAVVFLVVFFDLFRDGVFDSLALILG